MILSVEPEPAVEVESVKMRSQCRVGGPPIHCNWYEETQQGEDGHVMMETEITMKHLQAKKHQGFLANSKS